MNARKSSTITHTLFLFILFLLISSVLFLNIHFHQGEYRTVDFIYLGLFFASIFSVYLYMRLNIYDPIKQFEYIASKSKIQTLIDINNIKEDKINMTGITIVKSAEVVCKLTDQIAHATTFIEAIENGKLDANYQFEQTEEENLLAKSLLKMRDQMQHISEKEKERNWAAEGLARFADILRADVDGNEFYDNILSKLINYLNANQGGIYILNENDKGSRYFDLVAYYAYERKKYIEQQYDIREGLIGQCYMEKDLIFLTDVPSDYIQITSGTGQATPRCIIIIPLKINEEIVGVMEIASFNVLQAFQIDFLTKLGESIASTVSNRKIAIKTKLLLEESQLQAEQMRAQEEEMRQNMEELNATQEEMKRSENGHLQEIDRLRLLHEENIQEATLKNEELEKAKQEADKLMNEIQNAQKEITTNYHFLFEKFNDFNIESKFDQLTSIRSTKKRNIEDYFSIIRSQIMTYSEDKMIVDAMRDFKKVFHETGKNIKADDLSMMKEHLTNYYENEFLPRLNINKEEPETIEKFWDDEARTILMQYQYISSNNNETGKKHLLDFAENDGEYAKIHATYHPIIRNFLLTFGYYDIFLIDNETGHLVYSVFKEVDYTTSLLSGPYKNTNFAHVFREARNAQKKEFIKLVDFEPYDPSYTAPASFIATPIFDGDEKIGVLVFQMPIDKINFIMTGDKKWKEDGLGTSGETYLVGDDYKMRSISRFLIEDPVGYFNELERIGYNENVIKRIKRLNTTILLQDVKTEAVINALRGNADKNIVKDYRDISVLSAYAKLEIQDVNWVICSDIDLEEVVESISFIKEFAIK